MLTLLLKLNATEVTQQVVGNTTYTVAPVVAAIAPVMNGLYYPPDVWLTSEQSWDGRPVTIGHPTDEQGEYITVNTPGVLYTHRVGSLFNATFKNNGLAGEIWIEETAPATVNNQDGQTILANLKAGKVMEVSTGLFCQTVREEGEIDGRAYTERVVNLWPDHLAILPDEIGACSVNDGCGVPRVNQQKEKRMKKRTNFYQLCPNAELSFNDIYDLLREQVNNEGEYTWIIDIYADGASGFFVYEVEAFDGSTQLFRRDYTVSEDGMEVTNLGDRVAVERKTTYVEQTNGRNNQPSQTLVHKLVNSLLTVFSRKENSMDKRESLIGLGIAADAVGLLTDDQVSQILAGLTPAEASAPAEAETPTVETNTQPTPPTPAPVPTELTELAQVIREAGGAAAFVSAITAVNQDRNQVRANKIELIANSGTPFTREQLAAMSNELLDAQVAAIQKRNTLVDYSGLGIPQPVNVNSQRPAGQYQAKGGMKIPKGGQN